MGEANTRDAYMPTGIYCSRRSLCPSHTYPKTLSRLSLLSLPLKSLTLHPFQINPFTFEEPCARPVELQVSDARPAVAVLHHDHLCAPVVYFRRVVAVPVKSQCSTPSLCSPVNRRRALSVRPSTLRFSCDAITIGTWHLRCLPGVCAISKHSWCLPPSCIRHSHRLQMIHQHQPSPLCTIRSVRASVTA